MTPTLEPPTRRETTVPETFPYGPHDDDRPLPRPEAACVLRPDGAGPAGAAGELTCPACGDRTINGAGLFACQSCEWTGRLE